MAKEFKRRLSQNEEFDIMKAVFDKFLWLGVVLVGIGLYQLLTEWKSPFYFVITGSVVLMLFAWIIIKEFERLR